MGRKTKVNITIRNNTTMKYKNEFGENGKGNKY